MAYYSSGCYEDEHGKHNLEYSLTPYSYGSAAVPDSLAYSSHKFSEHQIFAYDLTPYHAAYDPVSSCSRIAYSTYTFSEPRYIEFDSTPYYPTQTQFIVSYSVSEFNEPEFEEYDPTPYSGGYDPTATYGKPLSPSDEICYPRSTPDPNALSSNGVSYGSITGPYGKEEVDEYTAKPPSETKQTSTNVAEKQPHESANGAGKSQEKSLDLDQGEESKRDYHPWSGYGNGTSGEHDYEYGKQVPQIPSGYGLEAMDLCESIFDYWPCLARNGVRGYDRQEVDDNGSYGNPWQGAADYLFGASNPYGERRADGGTYGNAVYGYQRHYQEQPLYQQDDYVENSWIS